MPATRAAQPGEHRAHAPLRSERRRPEDTVLYRVVQAHWDEFRERAKEVPVIIEVDHPFALKLTTCDFEIEGAERKRRGC